MRSNPLKRYPIVFTAMCFAMLAALTALVVTFPFNAPDTQAAAYVQSFESPAMTGAMEFFTWIGSPVPVAVVTVVFMLILFVVLHHRRELLFLIAVLAGSVGWDELIKTLTHRERPSLHRLIEETGFSFPSGHMMSASALYGAMVFLLWRHVPTRFGRTVLVAAGTIMILAIGVSRIYLGVHYPSDVLGGLLAGGCWLFAMIWLFQRYMERAAKHRF